MDMLKTRRWPGRRQSVRLHALILHGLMWSGAGHAQAPSTPQSVAGGPPPITEVKVINGCHLWPYAQCPGADLRHADLSRMDLRGVNFKGAKLNRADLRFANMAGAVLDGADLSGVKGNALNAPGASLVGARMVGTDFEMARFFRANFSGVELASSSLEAAKMNYVWFVGARLTDSNFQETKFVAANFQDAVLGGNFTRYTIFPDSNFEGCRGCPTDDWRTP